MQHYEMYWTMDLTQPPPSPGKGLPCKSYDPKTGRGYCTCVGEHPKERDDEEALLPIRAH